MFIMFWGKLLLKIRFMGRLCLVLLDFLGGEFLGGDFFGGEFLGVFDLGVLDFFFGVVVFFLGFGFFFFLGDLGVFFFLGEVEGVLGVGLFLKFLMLRVGRNLFLMGVWKLMLIMVFLVVCIIFFGVGVGGFGVGVGGGL